VDERQPHARTLGYGPSGRSSAALLAQDLSGGAQDLLARRPALEDPLVGLRRRA
jgi:hypothetical protein